jgi:hypothetical protein
MQFEMSRPVATLRAKDTWPSGQPDAFRRRHRAILPYTETNVVL